METVMEWMGDRRFVLFHLQRKVWNICEKEKDKLFGLQWMFNICHWQSIKTKSNIQMALME